MANIDKPVDLSKVWASGGDILTPTDAKIGTGWEVEIPPRQWFNWLDNRQDQAIAHINQHGVAVWDSATEYQADKSYTQGPTNGTIYRCVSTHTNQNPETDLTNTYWQVAFAGAGDFYTKTESDNKYLAKAQNGADIPNIADFRTSISVYAKAETYTKSEVDAKTAVASQAQAEAGASNAVLMTPLRTEQWGSQNVFGIGQTWQNLTGSRVDGVTYTNSTGRPIAVLIWNATSTGVSVTDVIITVNGVPLTVSRNTNSGGGVGGAGGLIIPSGATYSVNESTDWYELR